MNTNQELEKPVSVGDWILTCIILCIPLLGLIMLFVWAFGGGVPASKRNYCRAGLIFMLVGIILALLLFLILFATGGLALLSANMGMR